MQPDCANAFNVRSAPVALARKRLPCDGRRRRAKVRRREPGHSSAVSWNMERHCAWHIQVVHSRERWQPMAAVVYTNNG